MSSGWLGTGDAILKTANIWKDFSNHYTNELPYVGTILMPHHGAHTAYNIGLNRRPGIKCVFSAGTYNTYGHPSRKVIDSVLSKHGIPIVVTEATWPGFYEVLELKT